MSGFKRINRINKILSVFAVFTIAAAAGVFLTMQVSGARETDSKQMYSSRAKYESRRRPVKEAINKESRHRHVKRIPAYYAVAPGKDALPPVLNAELFAGKARETYCDESVRHQNLHSCFEDEHGRRCPICMDEALTAYRRKKEENLSPAEIRARIIAQYKK